MAKIKKFYCLNKASLDYAKKIHSTVIQDKQSSNTGTSARDKAGPKDAAIDKATNFLHPS